VPIRGLNGFRDNLTQQTTPVQIEQALLFVRPNAKLRLQNIGAKLALTRAAPLNRVLDAKERLKRIPNPSQGKAMSIPSPIKESLPHSKLLDEMPRTVDELTQQNIDTIVELEKSTKADRSHTERFAEVVTRFCGSIRFIWAHIVWLSLWSAWNTLPMLQKWRFDAFPFFFLCFILAVEAIFLASFILMNQRHEAKLSERRNHLDLQINLLSEQENTKMLQLLSEIAKKVGAESHDDPSIKVLQGAARPEKMLQQIDETIAKVDADEEAPSEEPAEEQNKE